MTTSSPLSSTKPRASQGTKDQKSRVLGHRARGQPGGWSVRGTGSHLRPLLPQGPSCADPAAEQQQLPLLCKASPRAQLRAPNGPRASRPQQVSGPQLRPTRIRCSFLQEGQGEEDALQALQRPGGPGCPRRPRAGCPDL